MKPKKITKSRGLRPLGTTVSCILEPLWARQDTLLISLIRAWPTLIEATLAQKSAPERLIFPPEQGVKKTQHGTLSLRIQSGTALEFQYQLPALIQRINSYFGYQAIGRIVLKQGKVLHPTLSKPDIQTTSKDLGVNTLSTQATQALESMQSSALQKALQGLGSLLS